MNILKSIWTYHCPRCRKTKMFAEPLVFTNPLDMHEECSNCEQSFEPEPGFYYGAMFLSYAIYSFILLPIAMVVVFAYDWKTINMAMLIIAVGLLIYFKVLRISRSLFIHIVVRYEEGL